MCLGGERITVSNFKVGQHTKSMKSHAHLMSHLESVWYYIIESKLCGRTVNL